MIVAILAVLLLEPTPSPTLSPLPTPIVNYYAKQGAQASGFDPALIRAIIDAESAGDPKALSKAGAVGMMQLEPGTASDCGIRDRFNAAANVDCGSRTVGLLVRRYGVEGGIAAYNFGSGNLDSVGGHLTKMPAETQQYVRYVVDRYDALQHVDLVATAPTPFPTATPFTIAAEHPDLATPICNRVPAMATAVGLQILNSLVVSNAVRHGSIGAAPFGSSSSASIYVAEHIGLDAIAFTLTRRSCAASNLTFGILGGSALLNAAETQWPK